MTVITKVIIGENSNCEIKFYNVPLQVKINASD